MWAFLFTLYMAYNSGAQKPPGDVLTARLKGMLSPLDQGLVYTIMDAINVCPNIPEVPSQREEVLVFVKELIELHLPD